MATTISKSWSAVATEYATAGGGYGGSDSDIDDTPAEVADIDLATTGYVGAVVSIEFDNVDSDTHDLKVTCRGSVDGSTFDTADFEFWSQEVDGTDNANQISFIITDYPHFKVFLESTGADDFYVRVKSIRWYFKSA